LNRLLPVLNNTSDFRGNCQTKQVEWLEKNGCCGEILGLVTDW